MYYDTLVGHVEFSRCAGEVLHTLNSWRVSRRMICFVKERLSGDVESAIPRKGKGVYDAYLRVHGYVPYEK